MKKKRRREVVQEEEGWRKGRKKRTGPAGLGAVVIVTVAEYRERSRVVREKPKRDRDELRDLLHRSRFIAVVLSPCVSSPLATTDHPRRELLNRDDAMVVVGDRGAPLSLPLRYAPPPPPFMEKALSSSPLSHHRGNELNTYFRCAIAIDDLLLEVLREQKNKGHKEDRAFSVEAYRKVVEEINEKFSLSINKAKSNPKLRQIRGKPLRHLDILRDIYEKDIAPENRSETVKEKLQRWSKEKDININDIDEMQVNNEIHLESCNTFEYESESVPATPSTQVPSANSSVTNTSSSKGKKRKASDVNPSELKEISTAMKEIAHAIVNTRPRVRQTSELFDAIRSLDVQDHKLFEAVDWLAEHRTFIDVFFRCTEELRLRWLYNKLGWFNDN
ncbi:hypothetical protein PIB30_004033 [Stylosanthes scabra]|uniref:Uncharacterized protein n=1 Tax=Stylosanthes scabra TaxID=79078 RepID=A0ABU6X1I9_9FABA|nr:hypothetical protein [Stylosanthes scabra]